jgi:hypothetical protein
MSIPHISFIKFDVVTFQQRSQFILERLRTVMFRLRENVSFHMFELGLANGKRTITALPGEFLMLWKGFVNPFRRVRFDDANQLRHRHLFPQRNQKMHMVRHTADSDENAIHVSNNSTNLVVQSQSEFLGDHRVTVFCAENKMHVETHKRLRHETVTPLGFDGSVCRTVSRG